MTTGPNMQDRAVEVATALRSIAELQQAHELPARVAELLSSSGLTSMCLPRRLGGGGMGLSALVRVVETVSAADASTGWCLFIYATAPWLLDGADVRLLRDVYAHPGVRVAGALAPAGVARPTTRGYLLSGIWAFGSGLSACDWVGANAWVEGSSRRSSAFFLIPVADVDHQLPWDGMGLQASGSGAFEIREVVVPSHRRVDHPASSSAAWPEASFRLSFRATFAAAAAVLLGVADEMLMEFTALAQRKTPTFAPDLLAQLPATCSIVSRTTSALGGARALLQETAAAAERACADGRTPSSRQQALLRSAINHVRRTCLDVVDRLHLASGGSGVDEGSRAGRLLRDAHTASQHHMFSAGIDELAGAALLGQAAPPGL